MIYTFKTKILSIICFSILSLIIIITPIKDSYSASEAVGKNRFRSCSPEGGGTEDMSLPVSVEGISGIFGNDVDVETSNTYCASTILTYYVAIKLLIANMNRVCNSGDVIPRVSPSPIQDSVDIAKATWNSKNNSACVAPLAATVSAFAVVITHLGIINAVSKSVFKNTRVCGADWLQHNAVSITKDQSGPSRKYVNDWILKPENKALINSEDRFNSREYREWYYDGRERESPNCKDPTRAGNPPQRYYFRGTQPATYGCENYYVRDGMEDPFPSPGTPAGTKAFVGDRITQMAEAYNCCVDTKKNSICIEYDSSGVTKLDWFVPNDGTSSVDPQSGIKYRLCKGNTHCSIDGIEFKTKIKDNVLICAETYSLCPYNFNLGGGSTGCDWYEDKMPDGSSPTEKNIEDGKCTGKSEIRDGNCEFIKKAGKCRNFCQVLENCVIVDNDSYIYDTEISSPYFSSACINFIGDSKNSRSYDTGLFAGEQNHFSAPIAQCVRETIENVFFNKAGHTKCKNATERPDKDGNCGTPLYEYKKGEAVENENFFAKLQNALRPIIQLVLILSITFTGTKVLAGTMNLGKKEIISYVVKIGLITYFVSGLAWQETFFSGIYKASDSISTIVMKITVSDKEEKRDGCQFGKMVDSSSTDIEATTAYPKGKEYLAIWDTMDCKIARYLGIASGLSAPFIAKLIFASLFTGVIGIWFVVLLCSFGIILIVSTIKMLHIFLASSISIIILVYISLITIPTMLFQRTKGIFDKWLTNLISLAVQPIILFAYIGIFVSVFDTVLVGSATFEGTSPTKTLVCADRCFDLGGLPKIPDISIGETVEGICDVSSGEKLLSPRVDSIACMVDGKNSGLFGNWPGLELIGIGIPVLQDIFSNDGRKRLGLQIITLLKGAIVIFILSSFIGQIPEVAQALVGGDAALKMSNLDALKLIKKVGGAANGVAKRARRGGGKLAKRGAGAVSSAAKAMGDKGKDGSTTGQESESGSTQDNTSKD